MNRSSIFSRRTPGLPVAFIDVEKQPNYVYFVDSNNSNGGDTTGHGQNPDSPYLTLDYAISQCENDKSDVIYIMPGHTESNIDISGSIGSLTVIGLGIGSNKPNLSFDDLTKLGTFLDNVVCKNIKLTAGTVGNVNFDVNELGIKVEKTAADLWSAGSLTNMFTVSGGKILLTHICLEIVGADVDAGASLMKIVSNPTVGTDRNLCDTLDVDGIEEGSLLSITGVTTNNLDGGSGGGARGMYNPLIIPEGTIDLSTSADGGAVGGSTIKCEMFYKPLDQGAKVLPAS